MFRFASTFSKRLALRGPSPTTPHPFRRILPRSLICLLTALLAVGCAVSPQQELQLGRDTHAQLEQQSGGLIPDPQLQQYVNRIGLEMAPYAGRPDMSWQYHAVNSDQINAFAVPGGYIYITKGLLKQLHNEAELAGILGHETAHIAHRDSAQQIERAQARQGAAVLAGVFGGQDIGTVAQLASSILLIQYTREQEQSADLTGLQYMTQAGYNPIGMIQAMQAIQDSEKGRASPPEFLSTHPNPGNRIQYLNAEINSKYAPSVQTGRYNGDVYRQNILSRLQ